MSRARCTDAWMLVNGVRLHYYQDWGDRDAAVAALDRSYGVLAAPPDMSRRR